MPDELDKSWSLLGPKLRQVGKDEYEEFWGEVKDVKVLGKPRAIKSNKVVVNLRYKTEDGDKSLERHLMGIVVENGKPRINTEKSL
ncbi:hypothetical protein FHX42_000013 [Saccharopolyspora lacisalsi]|uniref:Uncharacterized protein n=1 Tax=Halosaccharopolyspora lacisalsi TaxID=1000566 RepID=A0A839DMF8_9PSEU|nr:hypothetical protein [Halosaccharopolyspora lacisalsi]MBA8822684.1 hypothetical protein [Halosaccharopolyspora lacisalsi]